MGDRCHIGSSSLALYLRSVCLFIYSSFYSLGTLFALCNLFICLFIYFVLSIFWVLVLCWLDNWERFLSHPVGCFFIFLRVLLVCRNAVIVCVPCSSYSSLNICHPSQQSISCACLDTLPLCSLLMGSRGSFVKAVRYVMSWFLCRMWER